ncbi:MAG: DNA repair exonuclease [Candidatus Aenigmarchaeota archaeon]|nr:DNA repair exonuclease [Candidatus Aenigmarchaeota archaeon]
MISITSDFHLGYGYNTERENDCFFVLDELLKEQSDLILFAGDLFDSRIPRLEVLSEAMHFLAKLKEKETNISFLECDKKINKRAIHGIPFISIYGNHDRRPNLINPVQSLEKAGLLINLHCQKIVFELNGEKIAIHGMSHVPEKYSKDVLMEWNPKPVPGAKNILLLHQNIEPFIYSDGDEVNMKISDLPLGFDLIVNGHIHWKNEVQLNEGKLILPGSTVQTQLNKKESKIRKGYFILEPELKFKEIKQRDFYYEKANTNEEVEEFLKNLPEKELNPIIKIQIKNTSKLDLNIIEKKYKDKGILVFKKEIFNTFEKQKTEILRKQLSAEEYGIKLLNEKSKFRDPEDLLNLIIDDDSKGVEDILRENFRDKEKVANN